MKLKNDDSKVVGVLTGGGDCPGLNPAIRAVVLKARSMGWKVYGFHDGWAGVVDRDFEELTEISVADILHEGGTMLGTSRTDPRKDDKAYSSVVTMFSELSIDALIAIGGDDTLSVASRLASEGLPVVGVPKTMDNDLQATDFCIGFDSAVNRVTQSIDNLRTTARSHHRVMVVEVMGRDAGWVAVVAGMAAGADYIVIPEVAVSIDEIVESLERERAKEDRHRIVVISEGANVAGINEVSEQVDDRDQFGHISLASRDLGHTLAQAIEKATGMETRVAVLGHTQRGGAPTAFDRVLGSRLGVRAVEMVRRRKWGHMPALDGRIITEVPISDAVASNRKVDLELFEIARALF
tara:strand:+ start:13375 stop:14430 length:1056 start_codon:yes stop_codon:yes gene_type:complete